MTFTRVMIAWKALLHQPEGSDGPSHWNKSFHRQASTRTGLSARATDDDVHQPDQLRPVSLDTLKPGERGTIVRILNRRPPLRRRLLELGLINGTVVEFVAGAPLGGPIQIRVRRTRLSLRRAEAQAIIVTKVAR